MSLGNEEIKVVFKGVDNLSGITKKLGLGLAAVGAAAATAAVAIGAGLVKGLKDAIDETQSYVLAVSDLSRALRMTSEEASIVYNLADDLRIEMPVLEMSFKRMAQNGITPNIEGLAKLSDRYVSIIDKTKAAKFLVDQFGRSGLEMSRIMEMGGAAIRAFGADLEDGLVITAKNEQTVLAYYASMDKLQDTLLGLKVTLGTTLMPVFETLAQGVADWFANNEETIEHWKKALATKAKDLGTILTLALEGSIEENRFAFEHALKSVFGPSIGGFLLWASEALKGLANFLGTDTGTMIASMLSLSATLSILKVVMTPLMPGIVFLTESFGALTGMLFSLPGALVIATAALVALVLNLGDVRGKLGEWGMSITDDIQKYLIDKILEISTTMATFYVNFYDAGVALYEGLRKGITDKLGQIEKQVVDFIKAMLKKIKKALGIASPSSVFFDIGQNMMLGLQQGFNTGPTLQLSAAVAGNAGGGGASGGMSTSELSEIRDDIRYMVRTLPRAIRDVVIVER